MNENYEKRSDVPKEYQWAIEDLYASDEDWKKDLDRIKDMLPQIEAFRKARRERGQPARLPETPGRHHCPARPLCKLCPEKGR